MKNPAGSGKRYEYHRKRYAEKREAILAQHKKYREAHKEKSHQHYLKNKERLATEQSARLKRHKEAASQVYLNSLASSRKYGKKYRAKRKDWFYERTRSYLKAHPEKLKAYRSRYYQKNREELAKKAKARREAFADVLREKKRLEYLENKAEYIARARKRRVINAGAKGNFGMEGWISKVVYYGWKCYYCHKKLTASNLTMDHAIPLSRNGTNFLSNLLPACGRCNASKGAKSIREFTRSVGHTSQVTPVEKR